MILEGEDLVIYELFLLFQDEDDGEEMKKDT